jgi:asparagine synthase (glutamine-hydrolysing)
MCGIAGILGDRDIDRRKRCVQRMTGALVHRGPDDEGLFDDDPVTFGFRRLAVIDLETGQQPIVLPERRMAIVLNGEIYNFRELRHELRAKGHRFQSSGDVEVVLRLWAEEGADCLRRLNGMFALAVWEGDQRRLYLARDRFGIKPLFVASGEHGLAFASELHALRAGGWPTNPRLDPLQLRHYLAYGFLSPQGAPFDTVRSLPPASVVEIDTDGRERQSTYWMPPRSGTAEIASGELVEDLRRALGRAVARQLVADVPVGVFLSGGLDSSTLCSLARDHGAGALRTFSIGFEGPGAISELPSAREVATFLDSEHHEMMMDPAVVARDLDHIFDRLDAPLADPTVIPTWYMSRLAREQVTVALSGEGADEIFGGYARQRYDVAVDRIGVVGRKLLPILLGLGGRSPSDRLRKRLRMAPGLQRQLDWGRLFSAQEIDEMVADPLASESDLLEPYAELAERWRLFAISDPVNGRLAADREIFLPGDLLPKVDRMSMAHSLEVRVPYLDNEVVDLMLPLPGKLKQRLRHDKVLLRKAACPFLPQTAATRRKRGFEVPIGGWLRGSLRPAMIDLLSPDRLARQGLLKPDPVGRLVDRHLAGRADLGRCLWSLMVLSRWLETGVGR